MGKRKERKRALALADQPLAGPAPARFGPTTRSARVLSASRWAVGLTPEKLAAYLREAADGDPRRQAELFTEMEARDTHLTSVLGVRRRAPVSLPWRIEAVSERRTDTRVAEWVRAKIAAIRGFRSSLVHLMDAVSKGYAACEIDWRVTVGDVSVAAILPRPTGWFFPDPTAPTQWRIESEQNLAAGEPLLPGAWVWHESRARSGISAADSALGAPLAWAYLFKNYSLKDWVIFAEHYGAPIRIGKYQPGTSAPDRSKLLSALKQLGVDAAAIFPIGTEIELIEAKGSSSSDVYERLIAASERGMSKAVLGQTLTTEEGKSGSLALGKVHDQVRRDLLESDAEELSETVTRDLVAPLVAYRFGANVRAPSFLLDASPPEDKPALAKLYVDLAGLGVRFPVRHVHERFGIPMPAPGDEVYGKVGAASPVATPPATAATDACPHCGGMVALTDLQDLPPMPRETELAIREALDRGGYQGWEDVLAHLREWVGGAARLEDIPERLIRALETVDLVPLTEHIADEVLRADLIGRVQVVEGERPMGEWPRVPPRAAMQFWATKSSLTPSAFQALAETSRARAFSVARFTTLEAVEVVRGRLDKALAEGQTLAEFEDALDGDLAAKGLAGSSPWHIANVYRTNMLTASAVGRWSTQTDPTRAALRPFLVYDAVDDDRTRVSHRAMDGRAYPVGHVIWQTWYPPNGYQCRCGVRSASEAELAAQGRVVSDTLPTRVRVRPDGQRVEEPVVPDDGFRTNPALQPHEFDFARFPPEWRRALNLET